MTTDEIQRAHDILHSQITGETPFVLDEADRPQVHAALDVLCWVLDHDHSDGFPKSLATIEAELEKRGYRLFDSLERNADSCCVCGCDIAANSGICGECACEEDGL